MGQQQLLLVILVTIIVGVATVVALNVFGTSAKNSNVSAVRQDMLQIATSAQGWFIKPSMLAGGGNKFTGMTFADLNFAAPDSSYNSAKTACFNQNGSYQITTNDTSFTVKGFPSIDNGYTVTANNPYVSGTAFMQLTVYPSSVKWVQKNP